MKRKLSLDAEDARFSKLLATDVSRSDLEQTLPSDSNDGLLCDSCLNIDFADIFSSTVRKTDGRWETCIGYPNKASQCRLCRFFAGMATTVESKREREEDVYLRWQRQGSPYFLTAFSMDRAFGLSIKKTESIKDDNGDHVLLAVLPGWLKKLKGPLKEKWKPWKHTEEKVGFILLSTSPDENAKITGRKLSPSVIQWDVVHDWLGLCSNRHGDNCVSRNDSSLFGLRVIDCETREIFKAHQDWNYIALSYVWGESASGSPTGFTSNLPNTCPQVVEDAIQVTKQLNQRYLWIDRYCIDQDNIEEKHIQIANMDSVYAGSFLTIIAAAGDGSSYGLPGISTALRKQQLWVEVQDHCLVSSLPDPTHVVGGSRWMSRGWTYQEGILAKRKLVFTDNQVYYQCMGMYCFESMQIPLEEWHTQSNSRFRDQMTFSRVFPATSIARRPEDFLKRVNEYSKRSLSYESDTLNAVLGVLKVFERAEIPIYHHWGPPLFPAQSYQTSDNWKSTYVVGLMWSLDRPAERRPGFPSWSWTGWKGWEKLRVPMTQSNYRNHTINNSRWLSKHNRDTPNNFLYAILDIGIISRDGTTTSWLNDEAFDPLSFSTSSASIILVAGTQRLKTKKSGTKWIVSDRDNDYNSVDFTKHAEQKEYKAVLLGITTRFPGVAFFLLLEPAGNVYERVGFCTVPLDAHYPYKKHYPERSGDEITIGDLRFPIETLTLV